MNILSIATRPPNSARALWITRLSRGALHIWEAKMWGCLSIRPGERQHGGTLIVDRVLRDDGGDINMHLNCTLCNWTCGAVRLSFCAYQQHHSTFGRIESLEVCALG